MTEVASYPATFDSQPNGVDASHDSYEGYEQSNGNEYEAPNPRNLYVDNLPSGTDEQQLRTLFGTYGSIEKIKLALDKESGQPLGYAFILFDHDDDATNAMTSLNGHAMGNKTIRVSVAKVRARQHTQSPPASANVYVANLPADYTKKELDEIFSPYGTIMESRILVDKQTGTSRGVAFVRFETPEQATEAITQLNGTLPSGNTDGTPITVKIANEKNYQSYGYGFNGYGYGYPPRSFNGKQGRYPPRFQNGSGPLLPFFAGGYPPMPYGYPPMPYGYPSNQRQSRQSNGEPAPGSQLFVFHLPASVTDADLHQLFSLYGPVVSTMVMRDLNTGNSKGFGFVTMQHPRDAENAIQYLNGFALGNKYLKVSYKTNSHKQPQSSSPQPQSQQ